MFSVLVSFCGLVGLCKVQIFCSFFFVFEEHFILWFCGLVSGLSKVQIFCSCFFLFFEEHFILWVMLICCLVCVKLKSLVSLNL